MRRRLAPVCTLAFTALAAFPIHAAAQRVLGVQDDALVLPRGVFRVRVLSQWTTFNERYGKDTPGRPDGALEPLAIDFNLDTVGTTQFGSLTAVQLGLRQLTGNNDFVLSLGKTVVDADVTVRAIPLVLEAGITERISLGVLMPFVKTENRIGFAVNPAGREGNVGFNPALGDANAAAANAALKTEFDQAAAQLTATLAFCQANPGAGSCPQINAQRAQLLALIAGANQFAGGFASLFGSSPFVPIVGSNAALALNARVAFFDTSFTRAGVTAITRTGPIAAQSQLSVEDAQRILTDPLFGVAAQRLETVERSSLGDIEVGLKFIVIDPFKGSTDARMNPKGFNYRTSLTGVVRLPTGKRDAPNNFVDVGTGNEQTDIEGRWIQDFLVGNNFWASLIFRYVVQLADEKTMRITEAPNRTLAASFRQQKVDRDLGDFYEIEANPRWVFNDYFALTGHYFYRRKQADAYKGVFQIPGSITGFGDLTVDARTLNGETEAREHRFGGGAAFSTLKSYQEKRSKIPVEVTFFHFQTTRGQGGNVPKLFSDQLQVRLYARLFGN